LTLNMPYLGYQLVYDLAILLELMQGYSLAFKWYIVEKQQ
jgi:hypothetical protein